MKRKSALKPIPNSQNTYAFKEQIRIGGEIARVLPQRMTQTEVAQHLGISQQMVCRIERQALYKLRLALRAKLRNVIPCHEEPAEYYPHHGKKQVVDYEYSNYTVPDAYNTIGD